VGGVAVFGFGTQAVKQVLTIASQRLHVGLELGEKLSVTRDVARIQQT
jgi:hypothetical protein